MRPLVHVGFLKSWTRGGLDIRVVSRIKEIIQGPDFDTTSASICITGDPSPWSLLESSLTHRIGFLARLSLRNTEMVRIN